MIGRCADTFGVKNEGQLGILEPGAMSYAACEQCQGRTVGSLQGIDPVEVHSPQIATRSHKADQSGRLMALVEGDDAF